MLDPGGGMWGVFCVLAFPGLGVNADGEGRQRKNITAWLLYGKLRGNRWCYYCVGIKGEPAKRYDDSIGADIGHIAAGVFRASCQDPASYAFQIFLVVREVSTIFEQDVFRRRTGRDLPSVPDFVGKILFAINGHTTQGLLADIKRIHRARITSECPDEDGQMAATRQAYQDMTTFAKWAELRSGPAVNRSQGGIELQSERSCQDGSSR
ncbi:hypothetical protein IW262DRAFT_1293792 [Armillaria fumosa]|nr:hypothetical protein IW262DRAFT_1293792 [Armillaria fumosa]